MSDLRAEKKSVGIDADTAKKIEQQARKAGVNKKEYLKLSMQYFERTGINPAIHESQKTELEKMTKRLDQIIGFLRVQEREKLIPTFDAITATEKRIEAMLLELEKKKKGFF